MKKILKTFTLLLAVFLLNHNVKALETSFEDNFEGFAIDYTNQLNSLEILGSELLPGNTGGKTFFKISSKPVGVEGNYAEGKILYCADGSKASPAEDKVVGSVPFDRECYIRSGSQNKGRSIAYVYENGYGSYETDYSATEYLTGDYKKDYYITQSAVWYLTKPKEWMNGFDFENGTYEGQSNEVTKKISKLITDANAASSGASLQIEISNTKMNLTSDGKYYITDPIKLIGKYINSKITTSISGMDEAFVTADKDAISGETTFDNNSTVYIKVPAENSIDSSPITLNVTATTSIEESEAIECKHATYDEYQPVIIYYPKNSALKNSISVSIENENKFPIEISKKDITKSEELEGATLTIKDSKGVIIETWVSEKTTKKLTLPSGTYTLEEIIAPQGYELSETVIEFIIDNEGKILVDGKEAKDNLIIFENTPEPQQVPTGNVTAYIAIAIGTLTLGVVAYIIIKKYKNKTQSQEK